MARRKKFLEAPKHCGHINLLHEFLQENRLELWARRATEDVVLQAACWQCERNFTLSPATP